MWVRLAVCQSHILQHRQVSTDLPYILNLAAAELALTLTSNLVEYVSCAVSDYLVERTSVRMLRHIYMKVDPPCAVHKHSLAQHPLSAPLLAPATVGIAIPYPLLTFFGPLPFSMPSPPSRAFAVPAACPLRHPVHMEIQSLLAASLQGRTQN